MKIEEKNRGFWSEKDGFKRGRGGKDKEISMWCKGNWKVLKNYLIFNPIFAKYPFFETQMTCEWVTKWVAKIPWTQISKNFSKSFSRLGLLLANESQNPWVELTTHE